MYKAVLVACLVGSTFAQGYWGAQQQQAGQAGQGAQQAGQGRQSAAQGQAAFGGAAGSRGSQAAMAAGNTAEAQMSQHGAQASRVEASAANNAEAVAGVRRRQSVLLAADQEEGAGFEGQSSSSGSAGGGGSRAASGFCNGIPMTGNQHLCCDGQYYGDTWSELSCCGNSVFDSRFYGCKNNVMSPLYRPTNLQASDLTSAGLRPTRLCGNYVWQMYNAPYELCCDGVHYPNPYGNYGCCGARAFDSRYYNCGHDEVKQRWYVYKRSTFVLAATEELEAVGSRKESGVGRLTAEEGAVSGSQASARETQGQQAAAAEREAELASQAGEANQAASSGNGYGAAANNYGAAGNGANGYAGNGYNDGTGYYGNNFGGAPFGYGGGFGGYGPAGGAVRGAFPVGFGKK